MWQKKLNYEGMNVTVYENDDLSQAPIIKGLFIQASSFGCRGRLDLKFTDPQKLIYFHEKFTRLCSSFTSPYEQHNVDHHLTQRYKRGKFILHANATIDLENQYVYDLEKMYNFFSVECYIPEEIIKEIKEAVLNKELTNLEEDFWQQLPCLNKDNFQRLLWLAKKIVSNNISNANALWELAVKCKEQILIEEWLYVLKTIQPGENYYSKAQQELAMYNLAIIGDAPNDSSILFNGLLHADNVITHLPTQDDEQLELMQKFSLTFLGKDWNSDKKIFLNNGVKLDQDDVEHRNTKQAMFLVSILEYAKSLQDQVLQLEAKAQENSKKREISSRRSNSEPPRTRCTLRFS